jgi:hypothetical protein
MTRVRFALLFNGHSLERWHLRCLEQLEQVADLAGVVVAPESRSRRPASRLMRAYATRVSAQSTVDVTQRFADLPQASVEGSSFDFVLRLGSVATPAEIPSARHGLWYFEHESQGDFLPFFREVYDGERVTRAALLSLVAAAREPAILEEGYFRTDRRSYVASRDGIYDSIAAWPARACRSLVEGPAPDLKPRARSENLARTSKSRLRLRPFLAAMARARLQVARARLFSHPQWNIGVLKVPAGELLSHAAYPVADVDWFPLDGREAFLADPFGVVRDGRLHILCEYFDYRTATGHICTLDYSADGFTTPRAAAMPGPRHLSYPFLLEHSGEMYCVPETSNAGEIALYRAVDFPRRWSKVAVLVDDFAGVDPTVFTHDGRWWMLCAKNGPNEDAELWVWHASDLFGPWTPHERNPVKTDVRGTRPAGPPFVHEGLLYRAAQDCSTSYGGRVAVQRITRLTPTDYAEELVTVLEASPDSPFPFGPHTVTPVGDVVLVDGRRTVFAGRALRSFLGILARIVASKIARRVRR